MMPGGVCVLLFMAGAICALIIDAIRFNRRIECSRTEALRRLLAGGDAPARRGPLAKPDQHTEQAKPETVTRETQNHDQRPA